MMDCRGNDEEGIEMLFSIRAGLWTGVLLLLALGLSTSSASASFIFDEAMIDQTVVDPGFDLNIDSDSDKASRVFIITNSTGVDWHDYHFSIDTARFTFDTGLDTSWAQDDGLTTNPISFATVSFSADSTEAWFLDGIVAAGDTFYATLRVLQDGSPSDMDPFDISGTASVVVPEPGSAVLFAAGCVVVGSRLRRRTPRKPSRRT